jgi:tetratricopeptide (TPR) repeat protein
VNALVGLGSACADSGDLSGAIEYHQQALTLYRQIGDRHGEAASLGNLGLAYAAMAQHAQAAEVYQQSLEIFRDLGDRSAIAISLSNLGLACSHLKKHQTALECHQLALDIEQGLGNLHGVAASLDNLGMAYAAIGDYRHAIQSLKHSLKILRQVEDIAGEAICMSHLGNVYFSLERYQRAKNCYQQSLECFQTVYDRVGISISWGNLGMTACCLQAYDEAISYYQNSLEQFREIGFRGGEAADLGNLGNVYADIGEYLQAIAFFETSLEISRELDDRFHVAKSWGNIGDACMGLQEYQHAVESYREAYKIYQELGDRIAQAYFLDRIGVAYCYQQQYTQAIECHKRSHHMCQQIDHKTGISRSLGHLGAVLYKAGELQAAETVLWQAITLAEANELDCMPPACHLAILRTEQIQNYSRLQQVLVALGKTELALEVAESYRVKTFNQLLTSRLAGSNAATIDIAAPTVEEIRQIASQRNATLVQYSLVNDPDWLYIWVISPDRNIAFRAVDLHYIEPPLANLAWRLGTGEQNLELQTNGNSKHVRQKYLQKLYQLLITPIESLLPKNSQQLVGFIAQGDLVAVPFAALQDEHGSYFIEKHALLAASAIQVLRLNHHQANRWLIRENSSTTAYSSYLMEHFYRYHWHPSGDIFHISLPKTEIAGIPRSYAYQKASDRAI